MQRSYVYKPVQFFLITLATTWALGFAAAYFSYQPGNEGILFLCMLGSLLAPCVTALIMMYGSGNQQLIHDFWSRLSLRTIKLNFVPVILLLMPCVVLCATALSVLMGHSAAQFLLSADFNVLEGNGFIGIFFLFLAPLIEELGWRGYGVDSLRSCYTLFTTTMIFAVLWALWHLPLFFINGYYQYQLWHTSYLYAANFVISMLPAAIVLNWIYYKNNRSISAVVLMHFMFNLSAVLLQTEQFTKCIVTCLLLVVSVFIIVHDHKLFFERNQD